MLSLNLQRKGREGEEKTPQTKKVEKIPRSAHNKEINRVTSCYLEVTVCIMKARKHPAVQEMKRSMACLG